MICPKCLSKEIRTNTYQDTANSFNLSSSFRASDQKNHSCLWWLTIGWWWELTKLSAKIALFFPRLILKLFSAPFKGKAQTESIGTKHSSIYNPKYITVYTCRKCGHRWKASSN